MRNYCPHRPALPTGPTMTDASTDMSAVDNKANASMFDDPDDDPMIIDYQNTPLARTISDDKEDANRPRGTPYRSTISDAPLRAVRKLQFAREWCWLDEPVYQALTWQRGAPVQKTRQLAQLKFYGMQLRTLVLMYKNRDEQSLHVKEIMPGYLEIRFSSGAVALDKSGSTGVLAFGGLEMTHCATKRVDGALEVDTEYYADRIRATAKGDVKGAMPTADVKAAPEEYVKAFLSAFE
jgi:hypothetical protein